MLRFDYKASSFLFGLFMIELQNKDYVIKLKQWYYFTKLIITILNQNLRRINSRQRIISKLTLHIGIALRSCWLLAITPYDV